MKKVLIITGGSKGIGKGIILAYLAEDYQVISISRTINDKLSAKGVTQVAFDLTQINDLQQQFEEIFQFLVEEEIEKITLINNAGSLGQIGPIESLLKAKILEAVNLNTVAPMLTSAAFINLTKGWSARKTIINISSGAAQKPYFGWSVYCSTKAGLDMLTKTIAIEQLEIANGVKVLAVAPGVVDTDMQVEIRKSDKVAFKDVERFLALKADGQLNDVETVGVGVFEIDNDNTIPSGAILRVKGKS